jgi:hypothetical protein
MKAGYQLLKIKTFERFGFSQTLHNKLGYCNELADDSTSNSKFRQLNENALMSQDFNKYVDNKSYLGFQNQYFVRIKVKARGC